MNNYQTRLAELLKLSTLTPGFYTPSERVKHGSHAAVFSGDTPIFLTGPSDCEISVSEAFALTRSQMFVIGLENIGITGELTSGVISGESIQWKNSYSSLVRSESGTVEEGDDNNGELIAINLLDRKELTALMCINTSLARIFDENCPELDNGRDLSELAGEAKESLYYSFYDVDCDQCAYLVAYKFDNVEEAQERIDRFYENAEGDALVRKITKAEFENFEGSTYDYAASKAGY